jgi:hypothetical protein
MKHKGTRARRIVTESGELDVARVYYYCAACGLGRFPLDERWGLSESVYSPARRKQMAWLAATRPYAEAVETFERIAHRTVPLTSIWEVAQQEGRRLQQQAAREQAATQVERTILPPAGQDPAVPKAVSLDGGTIHIRKEGWKEIKTGTVGDIVVVPALDPDTQEWEDRAHVVHITYRAVLGDVTDFTPALWALAVASQVPTARLVVLTADGATWIWNLAADLFPDSTQIVDWYHATEYLARAAEALFPDDPAAAQRWQQERRRPLFLGEIHKIIDPLMAAGLTTQADYFRRHARRMQYQTFREEGYPIGSGTVESGIKQFKHRLAGPGMRWARPSAERMLVLRAAVLSDDFDERWSKN